MKRTASLRELPPDLLPGLPEDDQAAIRAIVGQPVRLAGYRWGKIELEFVDALGTNHSIWVDPVFVD